MQITASNPLAAHSLWTTLVSLADRTVEGCACGQQGVFPYTVVHYSGEAVDHLTINASNASFRISRIIDIEEATTSYLAQKQGYVGDVIKKVMKWTTRGSIDATEFFAGLIEFVQTYTTPDGAAIREQLSQAEAESIRSNVSKAAFYKALVDHESNRLDLRDFFSQNYRFADDLEQIVIERLPRIDAGIYTYASLNGTGSADTLVVKAPSGEVAVVFIVNGKYTMRTSSKKLVDLVQLTNGIDASFISSLIDSDSIIHGLLNQVTVE
jgi:hypothetical protein